MDIKFSIVTVVFNAKDFIDMTMESVLNQTYRNIEYIIVDGMSSDGTLDKIKVRADKDSRIKFISGKDKGIYDAMNKGVDLATGVWVNFMNAGDQFASKDTLESVYDYIWQNNKVDIIYGNTLLVTPSTNSEEKAVPRPVQTLWQGRRTKWIHQSVFSKRTLLKEYSFDISFKIGADFDFFHYHYINGKKFQYVDLIISKYQLGGFSDLLDFECNADFVRSIKKHKAPLWKIGYYFLLLMFYLSRRFLTQRPIKTNVIYLNPYIKYIIDHMFWAAK